MKSQEVRSKPILFSGSMVRAILDGRKTQTRRVVADANSIGNFRASELLLDDSRVFVDEGPSPAGNPGPYLHAPVNAPMIEHNRKWATGDCDPSIVERLYCRWAPGDRLWVRETWAAHWCYDDRAPKDIPSESLVHYAADGYVTEDAMGADHFRKTRPSIFMPRWASRITLEITDVRVERLQDISEEDAKAEGAPRCGYDGEVIFKDDKAGSHKVGFAGLWDSINAKKHPWESIPWVWVIEFQRKETA